MHGPPPHGSHGFDPINCAIDRTHAERDRLWRQDQAAGYHALDAGPRPPRRVISPLDQQVDPLIRKNNLAVALAGRGELARALALHTQALDALQRLLGDEHPTTLTSRANVANTLGMQGHHARALSLYEDVLAARGRVLGAYHPHTVATRQDLERLRQRVA